MKDEPDSRPTTLDELLGGSYLPGRASVNHQPAGEDDDGGRVHIGAHALTISEWLAFDWTRQIDDRLDSIACDTFDLADRVHYLTVTITVTFLAVVVALAVILAGVML